jgi:hypothetical protein
VDKNKASKTTFASILFLKCFQAVDLSKPEVKEFGSNRKLELEGKRWSDGGYAYGYDYNYARNLEALQKQIT